MFTILAPSLFGGKSAQRKIVTPRALQHSERRRHSTRSSRESGRQQTDVTSKECWKAALNGDIIFDNVPHAS